MRPARPGRRADHDPRGRGQGQGPAGRVYEAAGAQVIECPKVTRFAERLDFVRAEFRRGGARADDAAARALLDAVGSDLRELAAACEQLAADASLAGEGGHIDEAVVATYYRGRAEATGFSVADHAVEGHLVPALEQLRWALATGDVARAHLQRAGPGRPAAGPGRHRPPRRQRGGPGRRGGRPAVEDRPGPPAAARLDPGRHRPRAARRSRSRRTGQGRDQQRRLRPGTSRPPDRRRPRREFPAAKPAS